MIRNTGKVNEIVDEYLTQNSNLIKNDLSTFHDRTGNKSIKIKRLEYLNSEGLITNTFKTGEEVTIKIFFEAEQHLDGVTSSYIDIGFNNDQNDRITWISSRIYRKELDYKRGMIAFKIPHLMLNQGSYDINLHCETNIGKADWIKNIGHFEVVFSNYYQSGVQLPAGQGNQILDFELL